jgi:hypothetical protein
LKIFELLVLYLRRLVRQLLTVLTLGLALQHLAVEVRFGWRYLTNLGRSGSAVGQGLITFVPLTVVSNGLHSVLGHVVYLQHPI